MGDDAQTPRQLFTLPLKRPDQEDVDKAGTGDFGLLAIHVKIQIETSVTCSASCRGAMPVFLLPSRR